MQLTAQMLHSAFLEAQREVYGIADAQQRSWDNLTNKERLAYDWMIEGLNEKLATQENKGIEYKCCKCDYSFVVKPGQITTSDVKIHCDWVMEATRL